VRRWLIAAVTLLAGVYFFVEFFLPKDIIAGGGSFQWGRYEKEIFDVVRVIFVMSFGLGLINIFRVYGYQIIRRRPGWVNGAALLLAMVVTAVAGLWNHFGQSDGMKAFYNDFLFGGLMNNLSSAMFSLLAFYMASAAYRSFRVKSFEAALMMGAALIIMIGQIPLGYLVTEQAPQARNLTMSWISTPAFRGIAFGAMVAGLAMGVRMWLSLEKTNFGGDK
jgi:hypothetical protein